MNGLFAMNTIKSKMLLLGQKLRHCQLKTFHVYKFFISIKPVFVATDLNVPVMRSFSSRKQDWLRPVLRLQQVHLDIVGVV